MTAMPHTKKDVTPHQKGNEVPFFTQKNVLDKKREENHMSMI